MTPSSIDFISLGVDRSFRDLQLPQSPDAIENKHTWFPGTFNERLVKTLSDPETATSLAPGHHAATSHDESYGYPNSSLTWANDKSLDIPENDSNCLQLPDRSEYSHGLDASFWLFDAARYVLVLPQQLVLDSDMVV